MAEQEIETFNASSHALGHQAVTPDQVIAAILGTDKIHLSGFGEANESIASKLPTVSMWHIHSTAEQEKAILENQENENKKLKHLAMGTGLLVLATGFAFGLAVTAVLGA